MIKHIIALKNVNGNIGPYTNYLVCQLIDNAYFQSNMKWKIMLAKWHVALTPSVFFKSTRCVRFTIFSQMLVRKVGLIHLCMDSPCKNQQTVMLIKTHCLVIDTFLVLHRLTLPHIGLLSNSSFCCWRRDKKKNDLRFFDSSQQLFFYIIFY